jgi:hypothetical protein
MKDQIHHPTLMVQGLNLYLSDWKTQLLLYTTVFVVAVSTALIADLKMNVSGTVVVALTIGVTVALLFIVPSGLAILKSNPTIRTKALPNAYLESIQLLRDLQIAEGARIDLRSLAAHLSSYVDSLDSDLSNLPEGRASFKELSPRIESIVSSEEWQLIWYRWAEQMSLDEMACVMGRSRDEVADETSKATAKLRSWVNLRLPRQDASEKANTLGHVVDLSGPSRMFKKGTVNLSIDEYVSVSNLKSILRD